MTIAEKLAKVRARIAKPSVKLIALGAVLSVGKGVPGPVNSW